MRSLRPAQPLFQKTAKQAAMVTEQHVAQLQGQLEAAKQNTVDTQQKVVLQERRLQRAKQESEDARKQLAPLKARLEEVQGVDRPAAEAAMAEVAALRGKNAVLQAQLQAQSVQLEAANQAVRTAQLQKIEVTQQMVALQQGHLRGNEQAARQAVYAAEVKMIEAGRQKAVHEAELQQIEVTMKEAAHHAAQLQSDYEHLHGLEQHAHQQQPSMCMTLHVAYVGVGRWWDLKVCEQAGGMQ
ncbi:hypothetical protein HaLaN_27182 [Haematococcus lacustris]|uniref:Uncharacterized protein n=1 Tax=Haematococcus lacustris TaxID=44745 RepID=A0A6A0A816_HAELA|nr:hypothetical protein HaLaN_27182 [Haematococcus lacustris]